MMLSTFAFRYVRKNRYKRSFIYILFTFLCYFFSILHHNGKTTAKQTLSQKEKENAHVNTDNKASLYIFTCSVTPFHFFPLSDLSE